MVCMSRLNIIYCLAGHNSSLLRICLLLFYFCRETSISHAAKVTVLQSNMTSLIITSLVMLLGPSFCSCRVMFELSTPRYMTHLFDSCNLTESFMSHGSFMPLKLFMIFSLDWAWAYIFLFSFCPSSVYQYYADSGKSKTPRDSLELLW